MREIPLTQGQVALVDDEDYDRVVQFNWCAHLYGNSYYAEHAFLHPDGGRYLSGKPRYKIQKMHTFITGWERVDHKNGNGLDNRKSNLREATYSQNGQNKRRYRNNTVGYKGVTWSKELDKYRARIQVDKHRILLGDYDIDWEAALAYDNAAKQYHGEFAKGNFFGDLSDER